MISNVKFNELAGRVNVLTARVEDLETRLNALVDSQGGHHPTRYGTGEHAGGGVLYFDEES